MLKVLGVDPGAKGGLAIASLGLAIAMPPSLTGLVAILRQWSPDCAIVEAVHAFPGQGVVSCFSFGQAYGGVLGVLAGLLIPVRTVEPKAWHASILGDPSLPSDKAERRKVWKALAIAHCKAQWPGIGLLAGPRARVDHDGMADALCISTYDYDEAKRLED